MEAFEFCCLPGFKKMMFQNLEPTWSLRKYKNFDMFDCLKFSIFWFSFQNYIHSKAISNMY